ncbi:MAG: hypothetical protein ABJG68_15760 [Crocinitomicaceae bacterium]
MEIFLDIALILTLFLAFVQDWKSRSIHVLVFMVIAGIAIGKLTLSSFDLALAGYNCLFVFAVIGLLMVYVSLKSGKGVNIFKEHFGLGDLVFYIAITPLFGSRNFILFFISGLILSAVAHLIVILVKKDSPIPLAGYLSIYLIGILLLDKLISTDLFYMDII